MTELVPVDHDPFAEANEDMNAHYRGMLAAEQPQQETVTDNILGAPLTYTREVPGRPWSIEDENLNAGREINRGAVLQAYEGMQQAKNRPDTIAPETGTVAGAPANYVPAPRLSEAQEAARSQRGQEFVGNLILGATPVIGQGLAAKSAYEAAGNVPEALQSGQYARAAGSVGLAALGVAGALPAASAFRGAENQANIFGGWIGAENLAKAGRPTAYKAMLLAERLEQHPEATPDKIWDITSKYAGERDPAIVGVDRDAAGNLRFETMDPQIGTAYWPTALDARLREAGIPRSEIRQTGTQGHLEDVLTHPDMYEAYPDIKNLPWSALPGEKMPVQGYEALYGYNPPAVYLRNDLSPKIAEGYRATMHEAGGHDVANREGWSIGALASRFSPEEISSYRQRLHSIEGVPDAFSVPDEAIGNLLYWRETGEVNARNVEHRLTLTREERAAKRPELTEDVPREHQVFSPIKSAQSGMMEKPEPYEWTEDQKKYIPAWGQQGLDVHDVLKNRSRLGQLEAQLTSSDPKVQRQAELRLDYMDQRAKSLERLYGQNQHPSYDAVKGVTADLSAHTGALKDAYKSGDWQAFRKAAGELGGAMDRVDDFSRQEAMRQGQPFSAMAGSYEAPAAQNATRDIDPLGYYSPTLEAAKNLKQVRGTPQQMLKMLTDAAGSGSKNEVAATGLNRFLEGKKSVTRDDIVKFLEENRVRLNEVVRSTRYYDENGYPIGEEGNEGATYRWQDYSLDPDNPTYRETVLHLPEKQDIADLKIQRQAMIRHLEEQGRGDFSWPTELNALDDRIRQAEGFQSGHFPEPNITGHLMTSMVKDVQGRNVFNIDQIQSDWGQKLRESGVRDEAKITELISKLNKAEQEWREVQINHDQYLQAPSTYDPLREQIEWPFKRPLNAEGKRRLQQLQLAKAEYKTAEASVTGHPLVNTTGQWVNTTLRRALQKAIDSGADAISIPTGDTVLSYNQGDKHGMNEFYNKIVPLALGKIMKRLDPAYPKPEFTDTLITPNRGAVNRSEKYPVERNPSPCLGEDIARDLIVQNGSRDAAIEAARMELSPRDLPDYERQALQEGLNFLKSGQEFAPVHKFGFTLFPITDKVRQAIEVGGQPMFFRGGAVKLQPPKGFPHARFIGGEWLIPDRRNPGGCIHI